MAQAFDKATNLDSAVYLAQLSDGMPFLGLDDQDNARLAFKLNCLFFDEVLINATSLLGNRYLYSAFETDRTSLEHMYRSGLVRPLLRYSTKDKMPDNLPEIAERMAQSKTLTSIENTKNVIEHAEMIQKQNPSFVWNDTDSYWQKYNHLFLGIVSRLSESETLSHDQLEFILSFRRMFEDKLASDTYPFENISSMYRALDSQTSKENALWMKKCAEFSAQYVNSTLSGARLSIHEQLANYLAIVESGISADDYFSDTSDEQLYSRLAIGQLADLSLKSILTVRSFPHFSDVRKKLSQVRQGRDVDLRSIKDSLEECIGDLERICNAHNTLEEEEIRKIQRIIANENATKIVGRYVDSGIIVLSFLELSYPDSPYFSIPISVFLAPVAKMLMAKFQKGAKRFREANLVPNIMYSPKESLFKRL